MGHRHVCVHCDFYQPPRENPWTGEVEREESASPFHDWNARIADECYGPMTLGVRAGSDGRTIAYDETLKRLSFSFGPTLLSWLERERPSILGRILAADGATQTAIASPYFHNILPLESRRDKETLVRWGLAEFRHRYKREAQGLWLPETAADDETLEVLAAAGVAFTILDPKQAAAVRSIDGGDWTDVRADPIDPKTPYLWTSPKDPTKKLAVFFYHRRLSQGVVTGETVASVAGFADAVRARLLPGDAAQLVHVASDGELYGHHHPGAERVLTLALDLLEADGIAPINHARFLALFPPPREVKLRCAPPPDSSNGRAPLCEALTRLARRLDAIYEDEAARYFDDPWRVRDESIALWLAPGDGPRAFLKTHAKRALQAEDEDRALRLLMLQRERLAMFTSCASSRDDVAQSDAVLCLQRAARALDLAKLLGEEAEEAFVERLSACRSNSARFENGAQVWRRLVAPARVGLDRAAAHAAILDHLGLPAPSLRLLRWELGSAFRADKTGLAGRDRALTIRPVSVARAETRETAEFSAIVHRADRLDFACWLDAVSLSSDHTTIEGDFLRLGDDDFRAALDARFGAARFGLDAVLPDERGEIVKTLSSEGALGAARAAFLKRWVECITALRRGAADRAITRGSAASTRRWDAAEDDVLLELLAETPAHSFSPEELPWAGALDERLHARMAAVVAAPLDAALASRALRWLDALEDAGLLAGTWRLRDAQQRWSEALAGSGPSAALDACRALGARLGRAETAENYSS